MDKNTEIERLNKALYYEYDRSVAYAGCIARLAVIAEAAIDKIADHDDRIKQLNRVNAVLREANQYGKYFEET